MKTNLTLALIYSFFLVSATLFSQVGIGTTTPDPSAMLDISSTTQGLLAPRMTTLERLDIVNQVSPDPVAEGLLVFDTDLDAFYFYDSATTSWSKLSNNKNERDNYKLIKTEADLADELTAGGNTTYLLDTNTYYEINGTITLLHPIDLNNAYIAGLDANEDKLVLASGTMFSGANGGSIRNLTLLASGTVFGLSGAATQSLIFQNCIVASAASVGSISGFGVVFLNIIQFLDNTTGITYNNIGNLLLSNVAWFGNNTGTFETFTGTFGLIEKVSGFSNVPLVAIGIDVSSNPSVIEGVINTTGFFGSGTYVQGYTTAPYAGYDFPDEWYINCPGLLTESDAAAAGSYYLTASSETVISTVNTPVKFAGTTTATGLLRTSTDGGINNRIKYLGNKTRYFSYTASLSVIGQSNQNNKVHNYYIAKNGTVVAASKQTRKIGTASDVGSISLSGLISLSTGDYLEIWIGNETDSSNITALSMSMVIK